VRLYCRLIKFDNVPRLAGISSTGHLSTSKCSSFCRQLISSGMRSSEALVARSRTRRFTSLLMSEVNSSRPSYARGVKGTAINRDVLVGRIDI
jgi:hypothetical protein